MGLFEEVEVVEVQNHVQLDIAGICQRGQKGYHVANLADQVRVVLDSR
jgi:hypothetical protein